MSTNSTSEFDPLRTFVNVCQCHVLDRVGRKHASGTGPWQANLICFANAPFPGDLASSQRSEGVLMTCPTPTNAADDADPERAAPNSWDTTPENQAPTFRNQDHVAGYGYHWWVVPPLPGGVNNGAFSANGVYGQIIVVNPTEQVVIAIQSAWRQPHDSDATVENIAMIRAAVRALRTEPAS